MSKIHSEDVVLFKEHPPLPLPPSDIATVVAAIQKLVDGLRDVYSSRLFAVGIRGQILGLVIDLFDNDEIEDLANRLLED